MSNVSGGWTEFKTEITPDEMKIFKEAINGLVGVNYTPLAVASQVVNGTNYDFFCNGQVVRPNALNRAYLVKIFKPLEGPPELDEIRQIPH